MTQQIDTITKRLREIEVEIDRLEAERAMLGKNLVLLSAAGHVMRDDDVLTARNAAKFEMLVRVLEHLGTEDPYLYGGSSTRELYDAVCIGLEEDSKAREAGRSNAVVGSPLQMAGKSINYNTFRSYLSRFREEGRIFFDPETGRWRATPEKVESLRNEEEEDEPRD